MTSNNQRLSLVTEAYRPPSPAAKGRKPASIRAPEAIIDDDLVFSALEALNGLLLNSQAGGEPLKKALRIPLSLFEAKAAALFFPDSTGKKLSPDCAAGGNLPSLRVLDVGEGAIGRAFETQTGVSEGNELAVPLLTDRGPVGVLFLSGCRRTTAPQRLMALASALAAAVRVDRQKDESDRRAKDLQSALNSLKELQLRRETLLENVSEELRSPLAVIRGHLALMQHTGPGQLPPAFQQALAACSRSSDKLLESINFLIFSSRLRAGKMTLDERPFGLKALLTDVVAALQPLGNQGQASVFLEGSREHYLRGNRQRLTKALADLVEAAVLQASAPSNITLSLESDAPASVTLAIPRLDLDEKARTRLLKERVERALQVIQLHEGRWESRTVEGERLLRITLPVFLGAASEPPPAQIERRRADILLVEDDADCREVLRELLELEGYSVAGATSPEEAIVALEQLSPALVLLDLHFEGDSGRKVLRHVRTSASLAHTPVFVVSGSRHVASYSHGEGPDRIDGYFEKPYPVARLLSTVSRYVLPNKGAASTRAENTPAPAAKTQVKIGA